MIPGLWGPGTGNKDLVFRTKTHGGATCSLGWEVTLEKKMATHSGLLA